MAFIIGMYDVERSGETDRISIRGSGRPTGSVGLAVVDADEAEVRFIS